MNTLNCGHDLNILRRCVTRTGRLVVLGIVLVSLLGSLPAFAQVSVGKVARSVEKRYRKVTRISADVRISTYNGQLDETDESSGTLIFARGGKKGFSLRVNLKKPDETLSIVERQFVLYRPRLAVAFVGLVKSFTFDSRQERLFSFVAMTWPEILANYDITVLNSQKFPDGKTARRVRAVPKAKSGYTAAELWIEKRGIIRKAVVYHQNKDTTTITLSNIKENPPIAPARFIVNLPKGTKLLRR